MKRGKRFSVKLLGLSLLTMGTVMLAPCGAQAANTPWMTDHKIPAYQKKNMFETQTVDISGVSVVDKAGNKIQDQVHFAIFNSTKQEMQEEVDSKDGSLPTLHLIKDHNYTIYAQDAAYKMDNVYVWVKAEGKIVNIKDIVNGNYVYGEVKTLQLEKRSTPSSSAKEDRRVPVELYTKVKGAGGALANVKVVFTSDFETVEATSADNGRGTINVKLLEDVNYMVSVDSANWDIDPFPLSVKDKSEYGADKYPYDHTSCHRVGGKEEQNWNILWLVDKGQTHGEDTVLTNTNYGDYPVYADIAGNTTIEGLKFNDCLVLDREMDKSVVNGLDGDYDVIDIKVVNPHRWEFCKFATGAYTVTEKVDDNKKVGKVYCLKGSTLEPLEFSQDGNKVSFQMSSLSLYPVVVQYNGELEQPVFDPRSLTVKVVDEKGNPVEGLELYLKSENYPGHGDIGLVGKTNAEGKWTYECDNGELDDDVYSLIPVDGSNYTCDKPLEIVFGMEKWKTYISEVGGEVYTGKEAILTVKGQGGTEEPPQPVFDGKSLTVKVVDEQGNPVKGLELYLKSENYQNYGDRKPGNKTNDEGKWTYRCANVELDDDVYSLMPIKGSEYTCNSPLEITFAEENGATYISTIGGEVYTGKEAILTVKGQGGTEEPLSRYLTVKV